MLPLLPYELITQQLVELIVQEWRDATQTHKRAFDRAITTLLKMYVGRETSKLKAKRPVYDKQLWNVCGMKIRTNNAAESTHGRLNQTVSRRFSMFRFLKIIENEMNRTTNMIAR